MKVSDVMTTELVTAGPATQFKDLLERMIRADVSSLAILDDDGKLLGLVTETDLLSKEAYGGVRHPSLELLAEIVRGSKHDWVTKAQGLKAREIMSTKLVVCAPDEDVRSAARRMLATDVRHLPVLESGVMVGMVSRHDLLSIFDRPDEAIAADVARALAEDVNMPEDHHVEFEVEGGVVVLDGDVRYRWDQGIVGSIVREIPGVIQVVDHIHHREAATRGPPTA
jgi:CBS domain-containing protein